MFLSYSFLFKSQLNFENNFQATLLIKLYLIILLFFRLFFCRQGDLRHQLDDAALRDVPPAHWARDGRSRRPKETGRNIFLDRKHRYRVGIVFSGHITVKAT